MGETLPLGGRTGASVKTCFACARNIEDADRFCGHCGADQSAVVAVQEPAAEPAAVPVGPKAESILRGRGVAIGLGVVVAAAVGALVWSYLDGNREPGTVRVALDGLLYGSDDGEQPAAGAPEPEPSDAPTDPAGGQPVEATASPAPPGDAVMLQPGRWQFTTQLVGVSKVNPNDNFEISRQGIGSNEAHSICVTPAAAENPRAIAFPFQQALGCSPSSFDMSDGSYSSRLTCSFPQFGGRRPVSANGQYSRINASVSVNVQVPAQVVEGDFEEPPEILMQYRIQGYLTGPC